MCLSGLMVKITVRKTGDFRFKSQLRQFFSIINISYYFNKSQLEAARTKVIPFSTLIHLQ